MDRNLKGHFHSEAERHLELARHSALASVACAHRELAMLYRGRAETADEDQGRVPMSRTEEEARRLDAEALGEASLARSQALAARADRLRRDAEVRAPLRTVLGVVFRN